MTKSLMGLNQDGESSSKKSARNTTEIVPHDFCKKHADIKERIRNNPIIISKIKCSYVPHFPAQAPPSNKKNLSRKKSLIFPEMELSSSNIKNIPIFS